MSASLVICIVFFCLSFACLVGISFFYYKKYKFLKEINRLKRQTNYFLEYEFYKINIPLEHLSFNALEDTRFQSISNFSALFAREFQDNVLFVSELIEQSELSLKNHQWNNCRKLNKYIQLQIDLLNNGIKGFFDYYFNFLRNKQNLSKVMVEYRENIAQLVNFYKTHLYDHPFDNTEAENLVNELKSNNIAFYELYEHFDLAQTQDLISKINSDFFNTLKKIQNLYLGYKKLKYIQSSINEFKNILYFNYKALKGQKLNEAEKDLVVILKTTEDLDLSALTDDTEKHLFEKIINLKKKFNLLSSKNEFYEKNEEWFNNLIKELSGITVEIKSDLLDFKKYLLKNSYELETTNFLLSQLKLLEEYIARFRQFKKEKQGIKKVEIDLIIKIIDIVVNHLLKIDNLIFSLENKSKHFKLFLNQIAQLKINLTQMKYFAKDSRFVKRDEMINQIDLYLSHLEDLKKGLNQKNVLMWKYNFEKLSEVRDEVYLLKQTLLEQKIIKEYATELIKKILLININNQKETKIARVLDAFNAQQYLKTIDFALKALKN